MTRRILIITHAYDAFATSDYFLHVFSRTWAQTGHEVIVAAGLDRLPAADVAILHVDLSLVPQAYVEAARRYPVVINGNATDIRKTNVSRNLVLPNDGWSGPVIVKTDLNHAGAPEVRLLKSSGNREKPEGLPPGSLAVVKDGRYPILNSPSEVPESIWSHPGFVVERFLPERDGERYCLRVWVFFGDRERCTRYTSDDPLAKGSSVRLKDRVDVPDELRAERRRLGVDYGKFDFAVSDGKPVLFDANPTPWAPPAGIVNQTAVSNAEIAGGIDAWFGE